MKHVKFLTSAAVLLGLISFANNSVLADQTSQSQQTNTTEVTNNKNNTNQEKSSIVNSTQDHKAENTNKDNETKNPDNSKPVETDKESKPQAFTGWKTKNGKKYYYKNDQVQSGYQKIGNDWYLLDSHGAAKTGVQKVKNSYGYFDKSGRRQFKNTSTKKTYYWIKKNGSISGIKNNAKVICQRPNMPTGCEITAVTMMVNFAGKNVTKEQAAKVMHYSSDPNKGFIGSPYKEWPLGYWVAPDGIKSVVKHYLGKSEVMTGKSMSAIKNKLLHSHLVVMWVGAFDGFSNHAITLTGYHNGTIYYNDPWTGTKRSIKEGTLRYHWKLDKYRALSY